MPETSTPTYLPSGVWLLVLLVMPPLVWLSASVLDLAHALVLAMLGPLVLAVGRWWHDRRKRARAEIGQRDGLTGLPKRGAFETAVTMALTTPSHRGHVAACIVVDLDEFHGFNDRWGRAAGDELLRICASRLAAVLREQDLICRLDADAFAVFLAPSGRLTFDAVLGVVERLQVALADPVRIEGVATYISACMGVALRKHITTKTASPGEALLRAAERAMVEARNSGPASYHVYSPKLHAIAKASHSLAEDVSNALENGEIEAWFQPQVRADDMSITGVEALARWQHPKLGPISPGRFLPAVEAAGRSERLSDVMLSNALKALAAWDSAGVHVPQVGVNFAAHELRSPRLVEKIEWELDRYGLSPGRLALEILETVVTHGDDDLMLRNLARLRELGCKIELDDFGTGAAAITSIRRFGVTRIKIDRSFVTRLDRDPEQAGLCEAIVTMASQLGIDVLAEGVETVAEQVCLTDMGCAHLQGFGIARPMPGPDTLAWLVAHQSKLAAQNSSATESFSAHAAPSRKPPPTDAASASPASRAPVKQPNASQIRRPSPAALRLSSDR